MTEKAEQFLVCGIMCILSCLDIGVGAHAALAYVRVVCDTVLLEAMFFVVVYVLESAEAVFAQMTSRAGIFDHCIIEKKMKLKLMSKM
ncbi:hypothetical protein BpHYR1_006300 [Brachionus plicatilis]|uniref:Uncharacterized protein n=1 Tax=Brachionus plicatilis TaxID=10195 RepID=A0A3M7RM92_BRAPC|nr:hypothetical protein BpHYR1_006300 [Brachionus plicatilis]